MKKLRLKVTRNMTHIQHVEVFPWELPILQYVHGSEAVEQLAEVDVDCDVPDAQAECERLAARYGKDPEDERKLVFGQVFGPAHQAKIEIEKAIEAAVTGKKKTTRAQAAA